MDYANYPEIDGAFFARSRSLVVCLGVVFCNYLRHPDARVFVSAIDEKYCLLQGEAGPNIVRLKFQKRLEEPVGPVVHLWPCRVPEGAVETEIVIHSVIYKGWMYVVE